MSQTSKAMRWLEGKVVYSVGFGVVVLLLVGAGLLYHELHRQPPLRVVRIGYGAGGPVRKQFLEQLALHGTARNLDIRLVTTESTDQTLSLVDRHEVDLGLIAGAIEDKGSRKIFEVAPLYMEPLQLLVKEPLYEAVSRDFGALRGKSISLDVEHSGTSVVATELLAYIGLTDAAGAPLYRPVHLPQTQFTTMTDPAALPDAIFQIGGIPSSSIRHLITAWHYRLVALPFGGSFNLDKFREGAPATASDARLMLNRAFVEEFVIPAFTYSVLPPVPPADTRTIATRLLLVGAEDFDEGAVAQIVGLLWEPEISDLTRPPLSAELLDHAFEYPRHSGTTKYVASLHPVDVDTAFTAYGRVAELWGIIVALYVAAANGLKWWRQRKIADRRSVNDFLADVLAVEAEAAADCSGPERARLDQRLTDIKRAAIEMHLAETLEDDEGLQSLLVTVADARTRIWGPEQGARSWQP